MRLARGKLPRDVLDLNARRRTRWVYVLLAIAAGAGLVMFLRKDPSELPVYVGGAERMLEGTEIYRTSDKKPFTYPPFFALPFVPLVGLGVPWQRAAWYLVTLATLVLVLRQVARLLVPALPAVPRARAMFWFLVFALCARHLLAVFENQSHDMLVLLCVASAAVSWARGGDVAAGAWAGLGAACKATPALMAVPFLVQVRGRALLAATVVGAAATLLPDLLLPRADGQLWVMAWVTTMLAGVRPGAAADLSGTWTAGSILNQSLSGTVYRLTTPVPVAGSVWEVDAAVVELSASARRLAVLGAQLAVLIALAWLSRARIVRAAPPENVPYVRLGQAAAVACGMVLLSPMSSKSHFGVLVLPVALGAFVVSRGARDRVLLALLALVFVVGTLTTKGLVGTRNGNLLLAYGCVTWTAALGLLLAARAAVLLCRPALPAPAHDLAAGQRAPIEA